MADMRALMENAGIILPREALEGLQAYLAMLIEWNGRMDLTSVPPEEMAEKHFLDSLLPLSRTAFFFSGARLIDVGTGAGFPGLALAVARRDLKVTLLEAQNKRCQFLSAVKEALALDSVEIVNSRAELLGRDGERRERYDLAVARAVAPLNVLAEYLLPFVKPGGFALCWKGPAARQETPDGAAAARKLRGTLENGLVMSEGESAHVLIPIRKTDATAPQYPRKNGIPVKRPLKADKNP